VGLEETQLADTLCADTAGGEVGDAAVFELYPDVCDIDLVGEYGETDGTNLADGRRNQTEHDVEVVDHEVEHDVYVERAGGEDAESVRLEEHGFVQMLVGSGDGGVEPLKVTDLHDPPVLVGQFEDAVGIFEACCEGFLDQQVYACSQKWRCSGGVMNRRNADRRGVEWTDCGQTGFDGLEAGDTELCGGFGYGSRGAVDHSDERDRLTFLLELMEDTEMVASEGSRSDDCDAQWVGSRHYFFSTGASTA